MNPTDPNSPRTGRRTMADPRSQWWRGLLFGAIGGLAGGGLVVLIRNVIHWIGA
jgi:hypothetical protein